MNASGTYAARLLRDAADIVEGARNRTHGDKERSFQSIADLWNAYRATRSRLPITAADVAVMMVLLKVARTAHGIPIPDHFTDMAGYAAIAGELNQLVEAPDAVSMDTGPAFKYPADDDVDADPPAWSRPPA
jgi:hypothetical protein